MMNLFIIFIQIMILIEVKSNNYANFSDVLRGVFIFYVHFSVLYCIAHSYSNLRTLYITTFFFFFYGNKQTRLNRKNINLLLKISFI